MDLYRRVRLACHFDGLSQRQAAIRFGVSRETIKKMLAHSTPPGYRRNRPPKRPKLDPFTSIIDRILEEDRRVPRKQQHTAKRIFERLRDEHGFEGKETIVKDYVRERPRRQQEMFVPLSHPPGVPPFYLIRPTKRFFAACGDVLFMAREASCFLGTPFGFVCLPSATLLARQEVWASPWRSR